MQSSNYFGLTTQKYCEFVAKQVFMFYYLATPISYVKNLGGKKPW